MTASDSRVVIVGCGRIAGGFNERDERRVLTHVAAYRALGATVVGCCDRDVSKAEAFARRWHIPRHGTDLAAVLAATTPDVVSICTPPSDRLPVVQQVLDAPSVRAVLLEKPVAAGRADTGAIARLVEQSARPVLVNYCRAFAPFYLELGRECASEASGPLRQVTGRYYGTARTNASHLLERVIDMVGVPSAARRLAGSDEAPMFDVSFDGSDALAVFLPTPACEYAPFELDLLFERGRIRVVDAEQRVEKFVSRPDEDFPGFFTLSAVEHGPTRPSHENILYAAQEVLRAAKTDVVPHASFQRGVAVDWVLDEVGAA